MSTFASRCAPRRTPARTQVQLLRKRKMLCVRRECVRLVQRAADSAVGHNYIGHNYVGHNYLGLVSAGGGLRCRP